MKDFGVMLLGMFVAYLSLLFGKLWSPDYQEFVNLGINYWAVLALTGILGLVFLLTGEKEVENGRRKNSKVIG